MRRHFRRLVATSLLCGTLAAAAPAADTPEPLRRSSEPMSPADSLRAIHVTDGYEVELVVAEPLVMDPVAIDWDAAGRLWVAEMADYPTGIDGKGKAGGRIRRLDDTDGDGRYDASVVLLDDVSMPTGVAAWRDGVLVTAAGEIFYAADTNNDGKVDVRETLFSGFKEGNPQLRVNALRWGFDGWIYCSSGLSGGDVRSVRAKTTLKLDGRDLRIKPDTGEMELVAGPSQFGRDRDDEGNWFGCHNSHPLFHLVIEDRYLRRNPDAAPFDPKRQLIVPANPPIFARSNAREQFDRTQASPGHPGHFTSACSPTLYRDVLLFPRQSGVRHAFACEPVHNLVHHAVLRNDGATFTAARAANEQQSEFLASEDPRFRPVMTRVGPDGALWVVDMYRYLVEHPKWLPPGGEEKMTRFFRDGHDRGRIYRVFPKGTRPHVPPDIEKLDAVALVNAIERENGWQRDTAQRLLLARRDPAAVERLRVMAARSGNAVARLTALWTLHGLDALRGESTASALVDPDPSVRRQAVRLAEIYAAKNPELAPRTLALVDDPDAGVRLQLALTLGQWQNADAAAALAKLVSASGNDPVLAAAIASSTSPHYRILTDAIVAADRPLADPLRQDLIATALSKKDREALAKLVRPIFAATGGSELAAFVEFLRLLDDRRLTLSGLRSPGDDDALASILAGAGRLFGAAKAIVANTEAPPAHRCAAIALLASPHRPASTRTPSETQWLAELLNPRTPPEVQVAAVKAMSKTGDGDEVPRLLTSGWSSHSPQTRAAVLDALLGREAWAVALLRDVKEGRFAGAEFDPTRRQRLSAHKTESIRTLAKQLFGTPSPGGRQRVVEKRRPALSRPGDPNRGRVLFAQNCATCHRLGGTGQDLGPDLRSVSGWEPEALLVAILDPNRLVEPRYLAYTATLSAGDAVFGVVTSETDSAIVIKSLDGREQTLQRSGLKSLEGTNRSLMPDGFESALNDQGLADVIAFLKRPS